MTTNGNVRQLPRRQPRSSPAAAVAVLLITAPLIGLTLGLGWRAFTWAAGL